MTDHNQLSTADSIFLSLLAPGQKAPLGSVDETPNEQRAVFRLPDGGYLALALEDFLDMARGSPIPTVQSQYKAVLAAANSANGTSEKKAGKWLLEWRRGLRAFEKISVRGLYKGDEASEEWFADTNATVMRILDRYGPNLDRRPQSGQARYQAEYRAGKAIKAALEKAPFDVPVD